MGSRMPSLPVRALILTLAALAAAVPALSQDHFASIRGVVIDQAAAGIAGVEVRATPEATHDPRRVRTDRRGRFALPNLPPGTWRVEVDHSGFGPFIARMELVANQEFRLEVPLLPGTMLQARDLTAPFRPVDRSSAALNTFVDGRQMTSLPLRGRDVLELARLAPGVVPVSPDQPRVAGDDLALSVTGARPGSNAYYLDGVPAADPRGGAPAVRPPADGIREMQVLTAAYDASFGRYAGGQISVITRSGGNRVRGSVYGFLGGRLMSGQQHFAPRPGPAPGYSARQTGGSAGGPIVRDRLFVFGDYERAHLREDAARREGIFATGYDDDRLDGRIDYTVHSAARLTSRYSLDRRTPASSAVSGDGRLPWAGLPRRQGQHAGTSFAHSLSNAVANEVRLGYNRVAEDWADVLSGAMGGAGRQTVSQALEVSDTATWTRGTHQIRAAGAWSAARLDGARPSGPDSRDQPLELRVPGWSLFVQENWQATDALTLTAGVRYEVFAPAVDAGDRPRVYDPAAGALVRVGTNGIPRGGYATDRNNVAPRVGFSWAVDRERQNLVRAGYGLFYDQPGIGGPPGRLFEVARPPSAVAWQQHFQTPWVEQWTADVQHEIGQTRSLEVGYAGSRGHDLPVIRDLNAAAGVLRPRPTPGFAEILLVESAAVSRHDSLQVRYQERPVHGMSLLLSYTLGKTVDDAAEVTGAGGPPALERGRIDPGGQRARSSFDVRHRFSAAILRPLPVGTGQSIFGNLGWFSAALTNLELAAVVTVQTGRPGTVVLGREFMGGWWEAERPDITGSPAVKVPTADRWFNTGAFALPRPGTPGSSGRHIVEGPGYAGVDSSLVKRMYFLQRGTVELRLDAFNVFNRPNFGMPDMVFGSALFGQVRSTGSPRRVHLGLRAEF